MRRLLFLLALVLVNLPLAHQWWTDRDLDRHGRDVVATVVDARRVGGANFVDYRLPATEDRRRRVFSAALDDRTFRTARADRDLVVRVLPGEPGSNRPEGEVANHLFLAVAVGADLLLLVAWLLRRRARDPGHETLQP